MKGQKSACIKTARFISFYKIKRAFSFRIPHIKIFGIIDNPFSQVCCFLLDCHGTASPHLSSVIQYSIIRTNFKTHSSCKQSSKSWKSRFFFKIQPRAYTAQKAGFRFLLLFSSAFNFHHAPHAFFLSFPQSQGNIFSAGRIP